MTKLGINFSLKALFYRGLTLFLHELDFMHFMSLAPMQTGLQEKAEMHRNAPRLGEIQM